MLANHRRFLVKPLGFKLRSRNKLPELIETFKWFSTNYTTVFL